MTRLLITGIGQLVTPVPGVSAASGADQSAITVTRDASVLAEDGRIVSCGATPDVLRRVGAAGAADEVLDAGGRAVIPGFVDCHTHLVYAGNRVDEYDRRLRGVPYLEILKAGGGILDTVTRTRAADDQTLYELALARARRMAALGTTTIEAKSGYGLDLDTEMRMLRVVRRLREETPLEYVPTFMGAHAVPPEYAGRPDDYVDFLVNDALPLVAGQRLAEFVDVFCETGVFTIEQSERLLMSAREHGLLFKLHADELGDSGGSALGARLGAVSADHLIEVTGTSLDLMAQAGTIAVLLPATSVFIGSHKRAPARDMVAKGVPIALATDHNPGTSPVFSMQLVISLACCYLRLTPAEALVAATRNAACAANRGGVLGSLAEGYAADIVILDADDYREIPYLMGTNLAHVVLRSGEVVARNGVAVF